MKEVKCPTPLCISDQVITIGCCPVCVGTSADPEAQITVSGPHTTIHIAISY